MTMEQLARLLYGVELSDLNKQEHEQLVTRLETMIVPRIDFVDVGANKSRKWLVRKRKDETMPKLVELTPGNFTLVFGEPEPTQKNDKLKVSEAVKAGMTQLLESTKSHLAEMEKALAGAEIDDSIEGVPKQLTDSVAEILKGFMPPKKEDKKGDEGDADKKKAAAAAKGADEPDGKPAPATEGTAPAVKANEDGSFAVDDLIVTGSLATIAKNMAEAAGERMNDPEFVTKFKSQFADMQRMHLELDPTQSVNVALSGVSKRFNSELQKKDERIAVLEGQMKALMAGMGVAGLPTSIGDGVTVPPDATPTKKAADKFVPMYGVDLGDAQYNPESDEYVDFFSGDVLPQ
jgi:hypothetical protein